MDTTSKDSAEKPWSYVVAVASFIAQGILGGYVYTAGIFYTIFIEQFPDTSEVAISWLCSLPMTLWFIMGTLGSMITNRFGCRVCAIVGGLLCSLSLSLCFISTDFYTVFLFYGLFAGIGNGIHYVGFVTVVNRYFKKYRLHANIITPTGLTFGMALYAAIVPPLKDVYGWRGTLLILGGISFHICCLGCLLFPTESAQEVTKRKMINLSLLKDHFFQLFAIQNMLCTFASSMLYLHLPALITSYNLGATTASLSFTLYGIAGCFAKLFYTIVGCFRKPDSTLLYTFSLIVFGTMMILLPILQEQMWILSLVFILGYTYSVTDGHKLEVTLHLVGLDNVSDGLAFGLAAKASGSLLAGLLAGFLHTSTGLFSTSFYVGGSVMLISCVLMIPVAKKVRSKRNYPENQTEVVH